MRGTSRNLRELPADSSIFFVGSKVASKIQKNLKDFGQNPSNLIKINQTNQDTVQLCGTSKNFEELLGCAICG